MVVVYVSRGTICMNNNVDFVSQIVKWSGRLSASQLGQGIVTSTVSWLNSLMKI